VSNRPDSEEHPVAFGLLALVGVALVVGLILGLASLAGSRVLGVGEPTATTTSTDGEASMYLPRPQRTEADQAPEITLGAGNEDGEAEESAKPGKKNDKKKRDKPSKAISLSASQTTVSPMQQIDLTGTYPGGEGAILQVQRFEGGSWEDFPVTATVSNQTFTTYVQTGQSGVQRFRVVDSGNDKPSNEVRVTVE
jgi:hypothetical protein